MTTTSLTSFCESSSSRREAPSSSSSIHHDIFLSHSGVQKAFVKDLYMRLNPPYTPFFDIAHHSLPPGENFPKRIMEATKACKLAVVVLSDEFLLSKWPMIELCDFVKVASSIQILPVFYKLTPESLKHPSNVKKWHKAWKAHAKSDKRIVVSDWAHALRHLISLNGPVFRPSNQGEGDYLEEIVSSIYEIFPVALKYEDWGIHGKDRLCKIILAKFRELDFTTLQPCKPHDLAPQKSRVCMLGMYGLPGSGKSTLSRCLRDHFFPCFHGRSFYLELPTNPTLDQLLNKSKELLRNLPGCHNMVNLTSTALDIHQVYHLFKISSLPSSKVFFVVDNISSQDSVDFVQHLLRLGFGAGSKVLLVARTLDVLQPLLQINHRKSHYVCASLRFPSIHEAEAIQILLQSGGGESWVEGPQEDRFSPRDRQILEKVVRMSGFGPEHHCGRTYLPSVLKIMGNQLRRYEFDIEKWGREIESFWKKVEVCKEDAVRQLVQQSFESLSEKLQLLFLDIALFVLPSSHADLDDMNKWHYDTSMKEACGLLSIIHESSPERIEMEMYQLRQYCFVEICSQKFVRVHDMYLEFAASIPQSCMYYLSNGHVWRRRGRNEVVEEPTSMELSSPACLDAAKASQLRAIILELDEGQQRLEFSASLSNVRALVLRNFKSLTELGLAGLGSSLVSLEIDNCPKLEWVDIGTGNGAERLKRLRWAKKQDETKEMPQLGWSSIWMQAQSQLLLPRVSNLLSLGKPMLGIHSLATRFSALQSLTLENTGIKKLPDMSKCWPQLQELRVIEQHLEHFELRSLPKLKRFSFSDVGEAVLYDKETDHRFCFLSGRKGNKRAILGGKNMFVGCPNLEDVRMYSRSFVEGMGTLIDASKLHTLWIRGFHCSSSFPNLATPLPQSVERLLINNGDIRNVNFAWRFGGLRKLQVVSCESLVEVTGLDHLPNLCELEIGHCDKLQTLTGLDHLPNLCELKIENCDKLQTLSGLSGLMSLESFSVGEGVGGCPNLSVSLSELENLARLQRLFCDCAQLVGFFNVANLVRLEGMRISPIDSEGRFVGLERLRNLKWLYLWSSSYIENCGAPLDLSVLLGVPEPLHLSGLQSIFSLKLCGLQNVASLNGIEFLVTLDSLLLQDLKQLTSLRGIECLFNLRHLSLLGCVSVTELPPLRALVKMNTLAIRNCVELKAVEGCDEMTRLGAACFQGCRSLASLPLHFESLRQMQIGRVPKYDVCNYFDHPMEKVWHSTLHIEGCKFAKVDAMVAWAVDENVPMLLREASLMALAWEFETNLLEKPRERRALGVVLLSRVGAYFLEQIFQSNEEQFCLAFFEWANLLKKTYYPRGDEMIKGVMELLRRLAKVPKQQVLQQCRSDASFQLSVVEYLAQLDEHYLALVAQRREQDLALVAQRREHLAHMPHTLTSCSRKHGINIFNVSLNVCLINREYQGFQILKRIANSCVPGGVILLPKWMDLSQNCKKKEYPRCKYHARILRG